MGAAAVDRRLRDGRLTIHVTQHTAQFRRDLNRISENERLTSSHVAYARHCASASDNEPDGFAGQSPATYGTAACPGASYGCAIALRTLWYHPRPRWWTRAAASRRGAAR